MAEVVPITLERHGKRSWRRPQNLNFAMSLHYVPLVGAELFVAATTLPIAFVKTTAGYLLVAVLSLVSEQNMFVDGNGQWLGGAYVPASFRGYPFALKRKANNDEWVFCVDENSGLVEESKAGEPFWDESGNLSAATNAVLQYLIRLERERVVTQRAVSVLEEKRVICPWDIKIGIEEQRQPLKGLYRIDEVALGRLDDTAFVELRHHGALPLAYAQLISMANLQIFGQLGQLKRQLGLARERAATSTASVSDGVQLLDEPSLRFD